MRMPCFVVHIFSVVNVILNFVSMSCRGKCRKGCNTEGLDVSAEAGCERYVVLNMQRCPRNRIQGSLTTLLFVGPIIEAFIAYYLW